MRIGVDAVRRIITYRIYQIPIARNLRDVVFKRILS